MVYNDNMKSAPFYITTTLPYVNAEPHIGFALEIVQADVVTRYKRMSGVSVFFNTGTDEHGVKVYRKAIEQGVDPQSYCDRFAAKNERLKEALNLTYTYFIRTTNPDHKEAAQEFWRRCKENGDIYKKHYTTKYCVGCEMEKTDSELINGKCPIHPKLDIEYIEEENYFFRFSKYQQPLLDLYTKNPDFVRPVHRLEEIRNFVARGLEDFSISRLKSKMPWGVSVPGDDDHVMYVWFDALVNYISAVGWPHNISSFDKWWPVVQVAGKDNLRQQAAMWQAMLMSAQMNPSKQIIIHGFISSEGHKMSKSLGNVVNPVDLVNTYGVDAVRYYLLREIPGLDDGDYSAKRMEDVYNNDLANELGNLLTRVTTIAAKDGISLDKPEPQYGDYTEIAQAIEDFAFHIALEKIWELVKSLNKDINEYEPWAKSSDERRPFMEEALVRLHAIGYLLGPFLPISSKKILDATEGTIAKADPLFPRFKKEQ